MLLDDPLPDTIPLSTSERSRLSELEGIVQTNLESFLTAGRALCEIRNKRLFRQGFATFEDYCARRWGFSGSRGLDLARSVSVAEHLLSGAAAPETGDAPLPIDLSSEVLRPLQKLEPPLQSAVWRLASRVGKPTQHIVAKVVRVVEHAIHEGNGTAHPKTRTPPASEKKIFLAGLHRLAESRVPACVIVAEFDETRARKHRAACGALISRCHEILEEIRQQFPAL
jgi:hypothetical protein